MTAVTISAISFMVGTNMSANEKKVYIPDEYLREDILEQAKWNPETGEEEIIEDGLPTISQMERVSDLRSFSSGRIRSLEGLQYAGNVKSLYYSPYEDHVVDFRPISEMENLESFFCYSFNDTQKTALDISPFSKMKSLKYLHLGYAKVFDFSPLSESDSLEQVSIVESTMMEFPEMYVDRTTRKLVMSHPVTYSTQFDGRREVEANLVNTQGEQIGEADITVDGKKIMINDIDEGSVKIEFSFLAKSQDGNFEAESSCVVPIIWY